MKEENKLTADQKAFDSPVYWHEMLLCHCMAPGFTEKKRKKRNKKADIKKARDWWLFQNIKEPEKKMLRDKSIVAPTIGLAVRSGVSEIHSFLSFIAPLPRFTVGGCLASISFS